MGFHNCSRMPLSLPAEFTRQLLLLFSAVADLHSKILDAPRVQILSISYSSGENLAKSYVSAAPPKVGAPTLGKSWIRHCSVPVRKVVGVPGQPLQK